MGPPPPVWPPAPHAHSWILSQAGQAAAGAGRRGRQGCQLQGHPAGGGRGEVFWAQGYCLLRAGGAPLIPLCPPSSCRWTTCPTPELTWTSGTSSPPL